MMRNIDAESRRKHGIHLRYVHKTTRSALDLLETIAPDADAPEAQELVRAFIHTDLPKISQEEDTSPRKHPQRAISR